VWPALGQAFLAEGRLLAAWGATLQARNCGLGADVDATSQQVLDQLPELQQWQHLVTASGVSASSPDTAANPSSVVAAKGRPALP
jgi:hypothetical protein